MFERALFSRPAMAIYVMSTLIGCLYALVLPTLSVFLAKDLHVRPLLIGLFFVCTSLCAIVYGQVIALWSDNIQDRRKLIGSAMILGGLACLGFAFSSSYTFALLVAVTLFSLAFVAGGQIFALARDFADQSLDANKAGLFNSAVRACVAFSWVIGPPLGFAALKTLGYQQHYALTGALFIVGALAALYLLPDTQRTKTVVDEPPAGTSRALQFAVLAFSLLYAANHVYLIVLPLFLEQQLQVEAYRAGWLMGLTAALEIPLMIYAGWLAMRHKLMNLIKIGALAAAILHIGVWYSTAFWQLFVLQFFNAVFIGFIAGIGISWFQDAMPGRTGTASTLFVNCTNLGSVLGSILIVVIAESYGYRAMFTANFLICFIALFIFYGISRWETESKIANQE